MPAGRHRKTALSQPWLRRLGAVAVPAVAVAAALPVVTVLGAENAAPPAPTGPSAAPAPGRPDRLTAAARASRSFRRDSPPPGPADVEGLSEIEIANDRSLLRPRWSAARLELRVDPATSADRAGVLPAGTRILATGLVRGGWVAVVRDDQLVWARTAGLARTKPAPRAAAGGSPAGAAGVSDAPCPDGSAVESGLTANTVKVYRAVCAAFPRVTTWGGLRPGDSEHGSGRALDIMADRSLGPAIAAYARSNARALGVSQVIYYRRIWTVQRGSEGWRPMPDRGSPTANHEDHVHVTVY